MADGFADMFCWILVTKNARCALRSSRRADNYIIRYVIIQTGKSEKEGEFHDEVQ